MLIVLCYWLCLQLLHVDLIIIKRTLFFQHNNNKLIVKHQQHQPQHSLTRSHNNNNSTEIERQRERERAISLSRLMSREIELVLCINQPTNEQQQSSSLLDWLPDWLNLSIIIEYQSCVRMMMTLMMIAHHHQHNHNKYHHHHSSMKLSLRQYVKDRSWRFNLFLINMRTFILAMVTWEIHLFI